MPHGDSVGYCRQDLYNLNQERQQAGGREYRGREGRRGCNDRERGGEEGGVPMRNASKK